MSLVIEPKPKISERPRKTSLPISIFTPFSGHLNSEGTHTAIKFFPNQNRNWNSVIRSGSSIQRGVKEMGLVWLEAMLPLGIIAGMLCVMGNAQYVIHKAAHGRPKHIGNDVWDVAMERRDKKIMEMLSSTSSN